MKVNDPRSGEGRAACPACRKVPVIGRQLTVFDIFGDPARLSFRDVDRKLERGEFRNTIVCEGCGRSWSVGAFSTAWSKAGYPVL